MNQCCVYDQFVGFNFKYSLYTYPYTYSLFPILNYLYNLIIVIESVCVQNVVSDIELFVQFNNRH